MPKPILKITTDLVAKYGAALKSIAQKTVSAQDGENYVKELTPDKFRPAEPKYVDKNKAMADDNHTDGQAMMDFVISIAQTLSAEEVHELTKSLLELETSSGTGYLRGNTLAKTFLAYELQKFPLLGKTHLQQEYVLTKFLGENHGDMTQEEKTNKIDRMLLGVIISPLMEELKLLATQITSDDEPAGALKIVQSVMAATTYLFFGKAPEISSPSNFQHKTHGVDVEQQLIADAKEVLTRFNQFVESMDTLQDNPQALLDGINSHLAKIRTVGNSLFDHKKARGDECSSEVQEQFVEFKKARKFINTLITDVNKSLDNDDPSARVGKGP